MLAGLQSDLMSVPSPPLGPQSDWCIPYLLLSQGQDSLWSGVAPVWATWTLPGLWCCFSGIWRISQGESARCTGVGGAGLAHALLLVVPCGRGPEAPGGREAGRPFGGMNPQKHNIRCFRAASKFGDGNWFPLGFWLGDG